MALKLVEAHLPPDLAVEGLVGVPAPEEPGALGEADPDPGDGAVVVDQEIVGAA